MLKDSYRFHKTFHKGALANYVCIFWNFLTSYVSLFALWSRFSFWPATLKINDQQFLWMVHIAYLRAAIVNFWPASVPPLLPVHSISKNPGKKAVLVVLWQPWVIITLTIVLATRRRWRTVLHRFAARHSLGAHRAALQMYHYVRVAKIIVSVVVPIIIWDMVYQ